MFNSLLFDVSLGHGDPDLKKKIMVCTFILVLFSFFFFFCRILTVRGGFEDTRLETKAKDRPSRDQGPRTQTQVFSKKKVFKIFFRRSQKKVFKNFFQAIPT